MSFFWGGRILTAFDMTVHQKAPTPSGQLGKNLKCNKTSPYLANIRISKHTQDKSQELHIFCKYLALLCFELLDFENARSDWT